MLQESPLKADMTQSSGSRVTESLSAEMAQPIVTTKKEELSRYFLVLN